MYYKIISDGYVVDACDGLNCVRWQAKNRVWLTCGEREAEGVVSSDGGAIYLVREGLVMEGYSNATYEAITPEEYAEIRAEIDAGREIIAPDEPEPEPDTPAKTRLQALEAAVDALTQENAMLTECILEMSEIIYGG